MKNSKNKAIENKKSVFTSNPPGVMKRNNKLMLEIDKRREARRIANKKS